MKCFDQRLCLQNLRLADRYIKSKLQLLVKFSIRGIDKQFEACRHWEITTVLPHEAIHGWESDSWPHLGPVNAKNSMHDLVNVHRSGSLLNGKQQAVFLDIVKSIKDPAQVIPTSIWFDEVNCVENILPRS